MTAAKERWLQKNPISPFFGRCGSSSITEVIVQPQHQQSGGEAYEIRIRGQNHWVRIPVRLFGVVWSGTWHRAASCCLQRPADVEKSRQVAGTGLRTSATACWRQNLVPWGHTAHFWNTSAHFCTFCARRNRFNLSSHSDHVWGRYSKLPWLQALCSNHKNIHLCYVGISQTMRTAWYNL